YCDGGLLEQAAAGGRGRVKRYAARHGSGGGACRSLARFAVNPRCGAPCSVYRPENHHYGEAHPRPDQPHRPSSVKQNAAQRQMGRISPRNVPGAEIASEEEQIGNAHDDLKPDALRLPENESFPKANDTRNPEKLAGNHRYEEG